MAAGNPKFERGPYTRIVGTAITRGQLVQPGSGGTAGKVIPAAADSVTALGVANTDGQPAGSAFGSGTLGYGPLFLDPSVPEGYVGIWPFGGFVLTTVLALAFGDQVKCAANGQVTKWVSGTDLETMRVGKCIEPLGIGAAGTGEIWINIR
jgi:hypothetical protein